MCTVQLRCAIVRAAELAVLAGVSGFDDGYEKIADGFVALATGFTKGTNVFTAARSDFDFLLERAL